jgi:hypothetical protein
MLSQVSLQIHFGWQKKCRSTKERREEANTRVNEKSPKIAYTLLLMMTPHWFRTFPFTWYHYGDDSTNQKLRCVC